LKLENFSAAAITGAAILLIALRASACGPFFPNNLLDAGDQGVLQAPVADFQRELTRMRLVTATTRAVPLNQGQTYFDQATAAEMSDLAAARKRQGTSHDLAMVILQAHLAERMKLNAFEASQMDSENAYSWMTDTNGKSVWSNTNVAPAFPEVAVTPGLPREFAEYFAGAIAARNNGKTNDDSDNKSAAMGSWRKVLDLPPAERKFKSTWAAFMLAKTEAGLTNDFSERETLKSFEQVRVLARSGFADSLGLATASLGAEAQIYLRDQNYEPAIALYLEQFAAGDNSAINSLRFTAMRIFAQTNFAAASLTNLALNPLTRRVITAYLISRHPYVDPREAENDPPARQFFDRTTAWLEVVESAKVKDVESASQFALAAYQASRMDIAQRWINRARQEPVAQWLQAKLDLRAGKIAEAAELLAKLSRQFPLAGPGTNISATFADSLYVNVNDSYPDLISAGQQARGELGVLHLARREYTEALDALVRSGYWMDAAYVAERVLGTEELKTYVDRAWPAVSAAQIAKETLHRNDSENLPANWRQQIRCLVGRRLARDARYDEAGKYFPADLQPRFDSLVAALHIAHDQSLPKTERAVAFYAAAWLTRTNGLEIYGTEAAPDWSVDGGSYDRAGISADSRTNEGFRILAPTQDEMVRARQHAPYPDLRFHYRYLAAELAWQAGELMPDNSDDTARVLCIGGSWIKYLNPAKADPIYKSLVRRCRQTAIGKQADSMRWFPVLDSSGNPVPYPPRPN
jgi:hypothetical protein